MYQRLSHTTQLELFERAARKQNDKRIARTMGKASLLPYQFNSPLISSRGDGWFGDTGQKSGKRCDKGGETGDLLGGQTSFQLWLPASKVLMKDTCGVNGRRDEGFSHEQKILSYSITVDTHYSTETVQFAFLRSPHGR
jgi:hypothetical protein